MPSLTTVTKRRTILLMVPDLWDTLSMGPSTISGLTREKYNVCMNYLTMKMTVMMPEVTAVLSMEKESNSS
jgi:hypothetical protein